MASAFKMTTSVASPQNAGSDCVWSCSASAKYPSIPPSMRASRKTSRPSGEERAMRPEGIGGRYFDDCDEAPVVYERDAGAGARGVAAYALDPDNAERLWEVSARMAG